MTSPVPHDWAQRDEEASRSRSRSRPRFRTQGTRGLSAAEPAPPSPLTDLAEEDRQLARRLVIPKREEWEAGQRRSWQWRYLAIAAVRLASQLIRFCYTRRVEWSARQVVCADGRWVSTEDRVEERRYRRRLTDLSESVEDIDSSEERELDDERQRRRQTDIFNEEAWRSGIGLVGPGHGAAGLRPRLRYRRGEERREDLGEPGGAGVWVVERGMQTDEGTPVAWAEWAPGEPHEAEPRSDGASSSVHYIAP